MSDIIIKHQNEPMLNTATISSTEKGTISKNDNRML